MKGRYSRKKRRELSVECVNISNRLSIYSIDESDQLLQVRETINHRSSSGWLRLRYLICIRSEFGFRDEN